jgi:hypothetical protein
MSVCVRTFVALAVFLCLAACETTGSYNPLGMTGELNPTTGEIRSQPSVKLPPNVEVGSETLVAAAAISLFGIPESTLGLPGVVFSPSNAALLYIIYDPLAPNWSIKEQVLAGDTYRLALRAKSFRTGGDGEAIQIVKRRALQLQREKGFSAYRILDYSEGVESSTPFTHRISEGTIQLVRAQGASGR